MEYFNYYISYVYIENREHKIGTLTWDTHFRISGDDDIKTLQEDIINYHNKTHEYKIEDIVILSISLLVATDIMGKPCKTCAYRDSYMEPICYTCLDSDHWRYDGYSNW